MPPGFNTSDAQAEASLEAVADTGAEVVLVGHGEPWTGGAAAAVERARPRRRAALAEARRQPPQRPRRRARHPEQHAAVHVVERVARQVVAGVPRRPLGARSVEPV